MPNAKPYLPYLVNSASAKTPTFTKSEVRYGRRFAGSVVVTEANYKASGKPPLGRWDLKNNVLIGSATLIDYNYVVMCCHTYMTAKEFQDKKQLLVVFYNEITAATADKPPKQHQPEFGRPYCYLRGDIECYVSTNTSNSTEDFVIAKIEWNSPNDFPLIVGSGKLPKFTKPNETITGKVNSKKQLCYIQQHYSEKQIKSKLWTHSQTKFGHGVLEKTNQQPSNKNMAIYAYTYIRSAEGASGSPVYNHDMEVVGIVDGMQSVYTTFVPFEAIYNCSYISSQKYYKGLPGKSGGQKLRDIYNFRSKSEGW